VAVYYMLFILAIVLGLLTRYNQYFKIAYVLVMGFIFFILSAIRYDTGYDYNLYGGWYYNYMLQSAEELSIQKVEKGFSLPLKVLSDVFYEYQAMFVVIALVIAVLVMVYIYKYSSNVWVSVTAFLGFGLYFNSMNFMRQMIAALIVTYALRYIETKQFVRYFTIVLFASCFHFSALLMIPFYFILMIPLNWITLGIYTVVGGITYWKSYDILSFVTRYVYKGYDPTSNIEVTKGLPVGYVLIFSVLFVLAFLFRKKLIQQNPFHKITVNCAFFTMLFEFYGTRHTIVSRFALLFYIAPVLLLTPDIARILAHKIHKLTQCKHYRAGTVGAYGAVVICLFGFFSFYLIRNYNGVVPYQSMFTSSVSMERRNGENDV